VKTARPFVVQQKVGKVAKIGYNKVGKVEKNVSGSDEVRANDI